MYSNGTVRERKFKCATNDKVSSYSHLNNCHSANTSNYTYEDPGWIQAIYNIFRNTIMPLFLILFIPNLIMAVWYTATKCNGSFSLFAKELSSYDRKLNFVIRMWSDVTIFDKFTSCVIFGFCAWGLVMMKILPGKEITGPLTPKGNIPVYTDNGFIYYLVTIAAFLITIPVSKSYGYSPSLVYDNFGSILASLSVFSYIFCVILYFKGKYYPSSTDSGISGNVIFDYYWGTELFPRICGLDVKQFTNCRFGMMAWPLLVLIFALKSYELHGFVDSMAVSTALQMLYFTKFFMWEGGYLRTIDIILDRAGFYICWGCLVYIPGLYASVSLYLVNHPVNLGPLLSVLYLLIGCIALSVNYMADLQKMRVRAANGNCTVWFKPAEYIKAQYETEPGVFHESLLLTSGWWGLSRHFHYIPEVIVSLCWTLPAQYDNFMPYMYVIWLMILLFHRSFRDDEKCSKKYGEYWDRYVERVPYRIIPYLF